MKKENENRGAALVTVLIAVTFMAILASSLIYMAYMNYLTKAMRYGATDNFYTDEFALDELSTTLQQIAASKSTMSAAMSAIKSSVGYQEGTYKSYTDANVESLITMAKQDDNIASITVKTSDRLKDEFGNLTEDSMIVKSDSIELKGVEITATTVEGYTSTITSDIVISFPNSMSGSMDINDFSMILESGIEIYDDMSCVYSGNVLIQNKNASDPALKIGSRANMVLLSPEAMLDGNIAIGQDAALHITGDCIVYGDVRLDPGSVLLVSGRLKITGNLSVGSGARVIGSNVFANQDIPVSKYLRKEDTNGNPTNELAPVISSHLFSKVYLYDSGASGSWKQLALDEMYVNLKQYRMQTTGGICAYVYGGATSVQNIHANSNSLYLLSGSYEISSSMDFKNTTIMCTGNLDYNHAQGTLYMTGMDEDDYETAKGLLFTYEGDENSGSSIGDVDLDTFAERVSGSKQFSINGSHVYYDFAFGDMQDYEWARTSAQNLIANTPSTTGAKIQNDGGRTFVAYKPGSYSNLVNYLPVGFFISEKSGVILTDIFATAMGDQSPDNSVVSYKLWSKD